MNEIDFSLEHIDFALRRRFIWEYMGYDEETLGGILSSAKLPDDFINAYLSNCTSLNKKVVDNKNLGRNYAIGHTFFAEIAKIYGQLKTNINDSGERVSEAKKILWKVSLRPTLEAYCGSMDDEEKK